MVLKVVIRFVAKIGELPGNGCNFCFKRCKRCFFCSIGVSPIPLLLEGGVAESRGGRLSYNTKYQQFMHSPTTSPCGYSSFQKKENEVTTDFLVNSNRSYF